MTHDTVNQVRKLLSEGLGKTEIGKRLGLSRHQVRRIGLGGSVSPPKGLEPIKWGFGPAKLVKQQKANETVVFGSDFHFPYQDEGCISSFLNLIKGLQPDRVVLNGDIADFFQLSRFNISGDRLEFLQREIDEANYFRIRVRQAAPNATIDETEGNHDNRVTTYINKNAQALKSLRALKPSELFKYKDLDINWHPGCGFLLRPFFLVKHGTIVRGEAGATAKAELAAAGISGISGHTHRMSTYRRVGYVPRQWTEQGALCRLDPDYVVGRPNWTQGCAVGEFTRLGFSVTEVPYIDGGLRYGTASF